MFRVNKSKHVAKWGRKKFKMALKQKMLRSITPCEMHAVENPNLVTDYHYLGQFYLIISHKTLDFQIWLSFCLILINMKKMESQSLQLSDDFMAVQLYLLLELNYVFPELSEEA